MDEKDELFLSESKQQELIGASESGETLSEEFRALISNVLKAYFFKNPMTAFIGDVISSVLETAKHCNTNVQDYLTKLQLNRTKVEQNPENWLLWNYLDNFSTA